jgi:DNA-directed RNA polymerase specialized sigma24 family protein
MSRKELTFEQRLEVVKHLENCKSLREIAQIMAIKESAYTKCRKKGRQLIKKKGKFKSGCLKEVTFHSRFKFL